MVCEIQRVCGWVCERVGYVRLRERERTGESESESESERHLKKGGKRNSLSEE